MELRIFAARPPVLRPPRTEPAPPSAPAPRARVARVLEAAAAPTPAPVEASSPSAVPGARDELGDAALAILSSASAFGESVAVAFARIERELGALFASLPPESARVLHARLSNVNEGDAFAMQFARMVIERRGRLLALLANAPRRAALKAQL